MRIYDREAAVSRVRGYKGASVLGGSLGAGAGLGVTVMVLVLAVITARWLLWPIT